MPFIVMDHWYTLEEVLANPNEYYIFGDNLARVGKGGQAKIRPAPNAVGIATKIAPGTDESVYFDEKNISRDDMIDAIMQDFAKVAVLLMQGKTVHWPQDGIGTGLAELKTRSPHILELIEGMKNILLDIHGVK